MKTLFTRHAKHRKKWRKISEAEVKQVLEAPERQTPYMVDPTITNAFRHIGEKYLRVTFKQGNNKIIVISAVDKND